MGKILFSLGLVLLGLSVGYLLQVLLKRGTLRISTPIDGVRKRLQRAALLFFNPIAILGATWVADLSSIKIATMPVLGLFALLWGGVLAFFGAKAFALSNRQTGAYIVSGGFTNIGSLGALFCFIFLGEQGFALVPFYKLFEELAYYGVGFPIAKSFSQDFSGIDSLGARIKTVVTDIFVLAAVSGIGTGLVLNLSGIARPGIYSLVNSIFIPTAALLLLISIGMAIRFEKATVYLRPALFIAAIKFVLVPVTIVGLGYLAGLHHLDKGLPLKVVLILSAMPVGFIAMVPPTLYDLDIDLANACWLLTNGLLVVLIPLLMFILSLI